MTGEYNNIPKLHKAVIDATIMALTEAALVVESAAKNLVPVDEGALKGSLTHNVKKREAKIGTNMEYGPYVEYGTGVHAEGGEGRKTPWRYEHPKYGWLWTAGMKPQPYLRPALDDNIEQIKQAMIKKYGVAIKAVTR